MSEDKKNSETIILEQLTEDTFRINRDKNFKHLLACAYALHLTYLKVMSEQEETQVADSPEFTTLIDHLSIDVETVDIDRASLQRLVMWIDVICQILIEEQELNLQDEKIRKLFVLSQDLIKQSKTYGINI